MAPKKDTNGEAGKLVWEGANDTKLLLLTQGRYVKPDEYEQLASAFAGATPGSIRNRISTLRVKQRNMYEKLNWALPEGGAGHSAKKKKDMQGPLKRGREGEGKDEGEGVGEGKGAGEGKGDGEDKGEDNIPKPPSKKQRVPRKKKEKTQQQQQQQQQQQGGMQTERKGSVVEDSETGFVKEEPEDDVEEV